MTGVAVVTVRGMLADPGGSTGARVVEVPAGDLKGPPQTWTGFVECLLKVWNRERESLTLKRARARTAVSMREFVRWSTQERASYEYYGKHGIRPKDGLEAGLYHCVSGWNGRREVRRLDIPRLRRQGCYGLRGLDSR